MTVEGFVRWLHGDVVSSLGHGLVVAGAVVLLAWGFGSPGAHFALGAALMFYALREAQNLEDLSGLPGWRAKAMKVADGWLDWMVPLVGGLAAAWLVVK